MVDNQLSDIELLLKELETLYKRCTLETEYSPDFELEILKLKSEIVRLNNEIQKSFADLDNKNIIHQREIEYEFKRWKWQVQSDRRRAHNDWQNKMLSEAIGFAKVTINTLIIVGAGAVLAVLAFLGNILKSNCSLKNIDFVMPFIYAVVLAILTAMMAYICQIIYLEIPPPNNTKWGNTLRYFCIVAAVASLGFFSYGAIGTKIAFADGKVFECEKQVDQKIDIQSMPDLKLRFNW